MVGQRRMARHHHVVGLVDAEAHYRRECGAHYEGYHDDEDGRASRVIEYCPRSIHRCKGDEITVRNCFQAGFPR